jgi:hypothetical protein
MAELKVAKPGFHLDGVRPEFEEWTGEFPSVMTKQVPDNGMLGGTDDFYAAHLAQ